MEEETGIAPAELSSAGIHHPEPHALHSQMLQCCILNSRLTPYMIHLRDMGKSQPAAAADPHTQEVKHNNFQPTAPTDSWQWTHFTPV